MSTASEIQAKIDKLRRAEEEVRRLQDELLDDAESSRGALMEALRESVVEGLGEGEGPEAAAHLVPIAEVLGELEGPDVCDLLVDLLGSEETEVRFTAGRALQDLAYDRFREVAEAIERAVKRLPRDHQGLRELPYVIAEVGEPGVPKILRGYLGHEDAEVVAAAIEALAALGDPAAVPELRKLSRDARTVQIDDDDTETQASIGTLAEEAVTMIEDSAGPKPAKVGPPASERTPPRGGPPRGGPPPRDGRPPHAGASQGPSQGRPPHKPGGRR